MGTNRQMEKSSTGADLGNVWESNSRERSEEERGYKYRMMQWCNDVRAREQGGRQALRYK